MTTTASPLARTLWLQSTESIAGQTVQRGAPATQPVARYLDAPRLAAEQALLRRLPFSATFVKFLIVGGIAYTQKYPIERILRDVRASRFTAGSTEMMALIVQRRASQYHVTSKAMC